MKMPWRTTTFLWLVGFWLFHEYDAALASLRVRVVRCENSRPLSSCGRRWKRTAVAAAFAHPPRRRDTTVSPNNDKEHPEEDGKKTIGEDPLGPPSPLRELAVGGESLRAFRRNHHNQEHHAFQVERVASRPHIFVLRGLISESECRDLIQAAADRMETAETAATASGSSNNKRRKNCRVAWLSNDRADGLVGHLAVAVGRLVLSSAAASSSSRSMHSTDAGGAGYEDMQVVHYTAGGEYVPHHDGHGRAVTVLYYLTHAGETWFPLATTTGDDGAKDGRPRSREEALRRAESRAPGWDGVLLTSRGAPETATSVNDGSSSQNNSTHNSQVFIQAGDAVVFYNYYCCSDDGDDHPASMDWTALHAGIPVAAPEKWIANHWYHPSDCFFRPN